MKYLEKSFTLPASQGVTQEQWDKIWAVATDMEVVAKLDLEGKEFDYEAIMRAKPPATESKHPVVDTVAPGAWYEYENLMAQPEPMAPCPNCHCRPDSYRHIETCVTPGELD